MPDRVPRLILVTDRRATAGRPLVEVVRAALAATPAEARGAVAVQLREKDLEARALLELARALRDVTHDAGAALFVNDRVDVALAAGADGVHLGGRSLSPADVARVAPRLAVAVSTHARGEVETAARAGARFAVFGPVWDTPSKRPYGAPVGLDALRDATAAGLPLVALGGVTPENAASCAAAGAAGVACIRAVLAAPDPGAALVRLLAAFWKPSASTHG
ncbi:MAG TPA: thiamine phosphate synthase [Polyangia bacterium]|nr:thiamine phosphate synthase [Polyangia bacterium]